MNSSNSSGSVVSANIYTDKPDELASTGGAQQQDQSLQMQTNGGPQQQLSQHQKKCLHQRIFQNNANSNERLAALFLQRHDMHAQHTFNTNQNHQVHQQLPSAIMSPAQQQMPPQRCFPVQQMPAMHQRFPAHILRQSINSDSNPHSATNSSNQTTAATTTTTSLPNGNSIGSAGTSNTSAATNGVPIIHNQNGLVQPMNAALLAERYLLMDLVEGSTLYKCLDVKTHEELVCKVISVLCQFLMMRKKQPQKTR